MIQPGRRRRLAARAACLMAAAVLACLAGTQFARAAGDETAALIERRVKAAMLYRFINYVEWPEAAFGGPNAPFAIGIAGADALAAELTEFAAGRKVLNRPLQIRRRSAPNGLTDVQMVFVGKEESAQLAAIVRTAPRNALIVTESEDGLRQGSVINFVVVDGHVRFEVSLEAAQRRNIRLSSRLLSVAHNVHAGEL